MNKQQPILFVEDNARDIELTLLALEEGHVANEVVVARDGVEALDYLFAQGRFAGRPADKQAQLVLLDLKLPRVNGLEVLERMRSDARTKIIPVVVLTSSDEEPDLRRSYGLGANSYIRKPVDFNKFVDVVRQLGLYWMMLNQLPSESIREAARV